MLQLRVIGHHLDDVRLMTDLAIAAAAEGRSQVKAEAVHMHVQSPVFQASHDPLGTHRIIGIHRVATARVVGIATFAQQVVSRMCDLFPRMPIALAPSPFSSVVEDDIKHDLDASTMELSHQGLEPDDGTTGPLAGGKALHRHIEGHSRVTPVVAQLFACMRVFPRACRLVELENRQKLHAGDTQFQQVRDFRHEPEERSRLLVPIFQATVKVPCEAADMRLVNDEILEMIAR
mmetsp:Transcript_43132/g.123358  ORF Transcript_43132/g.123358 Transcript_43132/m.123358 type:complete len:233 (+) Transcript_43132:1422-2120(+)